MADNNEYIEKKKASLMAKSVRTVASTLNTAQLTLLAYTRTKQRLDNANAQLSHNTNGFYKSVIQSNKTIYRKQLESEKQKLESDLSIFKKQLDDMENDL